MGRSEDADTPVRGGASRGLQVRIPAKVNKRLRDLECPSCRSILVADDGPQVTVSKFDDCLRRCLVCGVGYSNSVNQPVEILRDAEANVPDEVREGVLAVLSQSVNRTNRANKRRKFGFRTSEDAVTWTVFRHLQRTHRLGALAAQLGLPVASSDTSAMLLWGVEVGEPITAESYAARQILDASKRLQEQVDARTEPDVVLDFGPSGLVVIEVKYLSGNDRKDASYRGWDRYLPRLSRGGMEVRQSGFYELTRLCLLARELAEQRPWVLVNLAFLRVLDDEGLGTWAQAIASVEMGGGFRRLSWAELLKEPDDETWFERVCVLRGLVDRDLQPEFGGQAQRQRRTCYTLMAADHSLYQSPTPGTLGGYWPDRIYGRLDCESARRWLGRGSYRQHRVFFADEATATQAGFRPCGRCLPDAHAEWKSRRNA